MAAAAVEWEVGPTKDVIQALMETLVAPRLPLPSDNEPPCEDAQKSIARQMHAVVLLYNYYHRKQNLELEFLDFMAFCKMALSLKPSLISFVNVSESMEMNSQISSTGKAIKEACDISKALDASKDFPTTKGWPISKVAILLIDSKGENCLLQYGAVTEGVWSLIEKEINESNVDQEILLAEEKTGRRKRIGEKASIDDSNSLQLAYNAVKDFTGIDVSNLEVLESGVVYSLSKEKSAAQFYMMRCRRPFSRNQSVPLKFLIESLRGPLAEKDFDGWSTTELVNYYHMLPYVWYISGWLSRKDLCLPASNGHTVKGNINGGEKELVQIRTPISVYPKYSGKDTDHISSRSSETKAKSFDKTADEDVVEHNQSKNAAKRVLSSEKEANFVILESVTNNGKKRKVGPKRGENDIAMKKLNKPIEESNLSEKLKKISQVTNSAEKEESGIFCEMLGTEDCKFSSGSSFAEDKSKKLNSKLKVNHHKRTNISSEDGVDLKSNDDLCEDENETANKNGIAVEENIEAKNAVVSEDLQNALALLYRKRQELFSQIRTVEDALAICEDNIERIRDGGEVGLARCCIKSIVSGNIDNQPGEDRCNSQSQKNTRLSEIFLPGKSSCQDLEYTCIKNNWRLPRYFLEPSDGKFVSNVCVESNDLKVSAKGEWASSPSEARESAAAQIIAKIMKICVKNDDQS